MSGSEQVFGHILLNHLRHEGLVLRLVPDGIEATPTGPVHLGLLDLVRQHGSELIAALEDERLGQLTGWLGSYWRSSSLRQHLDPEAWVLIERLSLELPLRQPRRELEEDRD